MRRSLALLGLLLTLPCFAAELQVHAAASLTDALSAVGAEYTRATGVRVRFNFGGSSLIGRQIREGAPGDVFFSADEATMDDLAARGLIVRGSRRSILSNALVVVVSDDGPRVLRMADLASPSIRRIAIAQPESVPAGVYARQYLTATGSWPRLQEKVIPTENVRGALAAVESGNADAAIVYRTDAPMARHARVALVISGASAPKISYPAAVLSASKNPAEAARFAEFLRSGRARLIFQRFGFVVP